MKCMELSVVLQASTPVVCITFMKTSMNVRLNCSSNPYRNQTLSKDPNRFKLHYGDLGDSTNLVYIIAQVQPTEIYNLGAQSHVKVSFEMAEYTGDIDA